MTTRINPPKKGKTANRRGSSGRHRQGQQLLDVRVRKDKAAKRRYRFIFITFCRVSLFLGLVVGAFVGGRYVLNRFFFSNPDYSIQKIDVQITGNLSRDLILRAANIEEGMNIFSVKLEEMDQRISDIPQVEEAVVTRTLPDQIGIRVTERKPVAWIVATPDEPDIFTSEKAWLVDANSVLLKQKTIQPEYYHLPVIYGFDPSQTKPGSKVETPEILASLELIQLADALMMETRFRIRSIDVRRGFCMEITDQNRAKITLGLDDVDEQLQRLSALYRHFETAHLEPATINLMMQKNIPVTFAEPAPIEGIVEIEDETILPASPKAAGGKSSGKPKSAKPTPTPVRKATAVRRG